MSTTERHELVRSLAGLSLFADLHDPDLEAIADPEWERRFAEGERVLRRGLSGGGLFVILEGEAAVLIPDSEPRRLRRGDFFGEVSTLLQCKPTASRTPHCTVWRSRGRSSRRSSCNTRKSPTGCCRPKRAGFATFSNSDRRRAAVSAW
jgi:CRP-like cAMP-binding protein